MSTLVEPIVGAQGMAKEACPPLPIQAILPIFSRWLVCSGVVGYAECTHLKRTPFRPSMRQHQDQANETPLLSELSAHPPALCVATSSDGARGDRRATQGPRTAGRLADRAQALAREAEGDAGRRLPPGGRLGLNTPAGRLIEPGRVAGEGSGERDGYFRKHPEQIVTIEHRWRSGGVPPVLDRASFAILTHPIDRGPLCAKPSSSRT